MDRERGGREAACEYSYLGVCVYVCVMSVRVHLVSHTTAAATTTIVTTSIFGPNVFTLREGWCATFITNQDVGASLYITVILSSGSPQPPLPTSLILRSLPSMNWFGLPSKKGRISRPHQSMFSGLSHTQTSYLLPSSSCCFQSPCSGLIILVRVCVCVLWDWGWRKLRLMVILGKGMNAADQECLYFGPGCLFVYNSFITLLTG